MKRIEYILLCSLLVLWTACEKDTLPMNFSPALKTGEATEIYRMGATLSGSIQKSEGVVVKDCGILLSELQSMAEYTELKVMASDVTLLSVQVKDLQPGKTYYYCAYASSGYSIARGEIKTFTTTESNAPVFGELQVPERDEKSVTVSTVLLDEGGSELILSGFCWKEADEGKSNPTTRDNVVNATPEGGKITARMKDLKADKEYAVCAYGVNAKGVGYGKTIVVKTQNATVPALSSITPVDSTALSIMVKASILSSGETEISEYGFCWSAESQMPTTAHMKQVVTEKDNNNVFSLNIADLRPETTYYIRAYAINGQGNGYGDVLKYTTRKGLTVTTLHAEVTGTMVVVYGVVTPGTENNHHGFEFATNRDDLLNQTGNVRSVDVHTNLSYNQADGTFHGELGVLEANTTYYVRAWFMDAETSQWVYGDIMEVRTGAKGIYTLEDLIAFRDVATNIHEDLSAWQDENGVVNLYSDIDMGSLDWSPIQVIKEGLVFDGNGHNVKMTKTALQPYERWGLFYNNRGTIRNLNVELCVRVPYSADVKYVGAVCADNEAMVTGCKAVMFGDTVLEGIAFGGIAAINSGTLEDCSSEGSVLTKSSVGGICGDNTGLVKSCRNALEISSLDEGALDCLGGIVAYNKEGGEVRKCSNTASIRVGWEMAQAYGVGGIVARMFGGTVANCDNSGRIDGNKSSQAVGGIVGNAFGVFSGDDESTAVRSISGCTNKGEIIGASRVTGNTCGTLGGMSTMDNCTYGGTVNGAAGTEANAIGYDGRKGNVNVPNIDDLPTHEW